MRARALRIYAECIFPRISPASRRYFPSATQCFENQNKMGLRRVDLGVAELTNRFGGGYWDDVDEKVGSALFAHHGAMANTPDPDP